MDRVGITRRLTKPRLDTYPTTATSCTDRCPYELARWHRDVSSRRAREAITRRNDRHRSAATKFTSRLMYVLDLGDRLQNESAMVSVNVNSIPGLADYQQIDPLEVDLPVERPCTGHITGQVLQGRPHLDPAPKSRSSGSGSPNGTRLSHVGRERNVASSRESSICGNGTQTSVYQAGVIRVAPSTGCWPPVLGQPTDAGSVELVHGQDPRVADPTEAFQLLAESEHPVVRA